MSPRACIAMVLFAAVTGCVGTMDSLHRVTGIAPDIEGCEVRVTAAGSHDVLARERVRGEFSVTYAAPGVAPKVDVIATCAGVAVAERKSVAPRESGVLALGRVAP